MKKLNKSRIFTVFFLFVLAIVSLPICAQTEQPATDMVPETTTQEKVNHVLFSPDFLGMVTGSYGFGFDIRLSDNIALYLEPTYFNIVLIPYFGTIIANETDVSVWYFKLSTGITWYPTKLFNGFFLRGYLRANIFNTDVDDTSLYAGSFGGGFHCGVTAGNNQIRWITYGGLELAHGFLIDDSKYTSITDMTSDKALLFSLIGLHGVSPTFTTAVSFAL